MARVIRMSPAANHSKKPWPEWEIKGHGQLTQPRTQ
jgi:hypothetical protein